MDSGVSSKSPLGAPKTEPNKGHVGLDRNMDVREVIMVFLISFVCGLEDSHIPTRWLLLDFACKHAKPLVVSAYLG